MKNILKLIVSKPMKYNKNANTILILLLFTTGQRGKILKKYYFLVQALKKSEKQWVLGVLYRNICRILNANFQYNLYLREVNLSYFQLTKKLKRFHKRFSRQRILKTYNKRLQKVLSNFSCRWRVLNLYFKNVQENSVYKEPCFERKIKSEIKLNSEHFL